MIAARGTVTWCAARVGRIPRRSETGGVSIYAAPARATDLAGLPATFVMVEAWTCCETRTSTTLGVW